MPPSFLDSFVRDATDTVARPSDPRLLADTVGELVRRLVQGPFFLDDPPQPSPDGPARKELFADPEGRLLVTVCAWAPKQASTIHDHEGWGVIAAVANRIVSTCYRRVDDGATAGYASLTEITRTLVTETSFAFVRPPEESIHRLDNPYPTPALTLHVFGGDAGLQHVYDPRAKSIVASGEPSPARGV